jgi:Zn finger protein HypA/HybF involved in hydrogenase expression
MKKALNDQGFLTCSKMEGMDTPKKRNKYTTESFLIAVKAVNPNDLDYSKVEYKNSDTRIKLKCNTCQFEFESKPLDVLYKKTGCRKCYLVRFAKIASKREIGWESLILKLRQVHGDVYDYNRGAYEAGDEKLTISCKIHGKFYQTPYNHLQGQKCPACSTANSSKKRALGWETYLNRVKAIHLERYNYPDQTYTNQNTHVDIICPEHGLFSQVAQTHLSGHGCPTCGKIYSFQQREMNEYINSLGVSTIENFKLENGKHLDIFCPELNIAFEYNGLIWHSEKFNTDSLYHLGKTVAAKKEGVRLIHIFEDEWLFYKDRVCLYIKTVLGKNTNKLDARKLVLDDKCTWRETTDLLEQIHMQGSCAPASLCYGLRDAKTNELLSVMVFNGRDVKTGELELIRFCSKGVIRGGFTRLLTRAITNLKPNSIISFSDTRISDGAVYFKNQFSYIGEVTPRYWYTKNKQRFNRRGFQKQYLDKKLKTYDPNKTERDNCFINGYYRIWDCGKKKWKLSLK